MPYLVFELITKSHIRVFTPYKRVSEKGTLFFYVKVRTFPSSDFLICSKMFILEHVNR